MAEGRIVGLVPAAGRGTRLGSLPGSKELLPVPASDAHSGDPVLLPVCTSLLKLMRNGGVNEVVVVLRSGKWDIPAYLADGERFGLSIGYAVMRYPFGAPFTLDAAWPFVQDATVVLGFPDVLIEPDTVFRTLLDALGTSDADLALGLFPADRPHATDMVRTGLDGRVLHLDIRPSRTELTHAWCIAAWRPAFTSFLHHWVGAKVHPPGQAMRETDEYYVGEVIRSAIEEGLHVIGVVVSDRPFLDIGTPETYARAMARFSDRDLI